MRICIVAHFAYPAFAGQGTSYVGGVERQTAMLSRWLATRGHQVSLVTWDEGQPGGLQPDGVHIIKVCSQSAGIPGLRFFYPRWTSLNSALRQADADVYYHNGGESTTGQIALWCRLRHRKFVFSAAALGDCDIRLPILETARERALCRLGIKCADQIIVQTRTQYELLLQGFKRRSLAIPMPVATPTEAQSTVRTLPPTGKRRVLWVGRISEEKRPDRLLDIAERCPDLDFDIVGPSPGSKYARELIDRAQKVPNVTMHGGKTQELLASFYKLSSCLCSTSENEGFPNIFVEAWSYGLPSVSIFDPDSVIAKHSLGLVASDVAGIESAIRQLFLSSALWERASQSARNYYFQNHSIDLVMPHFEQVFVRLAELIAEPKPSDERIGSTPTS